MRDSEGIVMMHLSLLSLCGSLEQHRLPKLQANTLQYSLAAASNTAIGSPLGEALPR
jgi:hypothetical protein